MTKRDKQLRKQRRAYKKRLKERMKNGEGKGPSQTPSPYGYSRKEGRGQSSAGDDYRGSWRAGRYGVF